jgi:ABC-type branched-subunit amino acid transport system ATPase component
VATVMQLRDVTKRFGGLTAVNGLSLDVHEKTIHALIGPNGSGKTTVINLISGLLKPDGGRILHTDERLDQLPAYRIARRGIGRTFQNIKLFGSMNVIDNVMVGGHAHTHVGIARFLCNPAAARREEQPLRKKAEEILQFIGLYEVRDELVKNLPYGRQKKVEIGRALMTDPKLLLLDEPAAGLNPSERSEFIQLLIKMFDDGILLFLIEHNMDVVMNMSHTITVLNFGAKIAEGPPKEIQNNAEVIKAYLGDRNKSRKT